MLYYAHSRRQALYKWKLTELLQVNVLHVPNNQPLAGRLGGSLKSSYHPLGQVSSTAQFLPARRYVSAGTSYVPVSVCLSVTSRSSVETVKRIGLVFGMGASFVL